MPEKRKEGKDGAIRSPKQSWSLTHSNIEIPNGKVNAPARRPKTPSHAQPKGTRLPNPEWNRDMAPNTVKAPQGDLLITSVKQNNELQLLPNDMLAERNRQALKLKDEFFNERNDDYYKELVRDIEVARAEGQSSTQWLANHSLTALNLTVEAILNECIPVKSPLDALGPSQVGQHVRVYNSVLDEYESKLRRFLTICQERIRWLLRDSRRAFGLVTASRPCILFDVSDTNTGFGRLKLIQNSLKQLVGEQLAKKEKLYVCSFGTTIQPLWSTARDLNCRIAEEMHHWIDCLQPDGGCNVMSAVRHAVKRWDVDCVILILGNCPDQNPQTIIDYVDESIAGRSIPFHTVAYNCSMSATNMFLEELSNKTKGRYHCYSATSEAEIMSGTDLKFLAAEVKRAVTVLSQIQEMRQGGMVENRIVSVADQPHLEIEVTSTGKELEVYGGKVPTLSIETPCFPVRTSKEWLSEHSLKAKGLTLYQVMAPNAFNYIQGYVSSINRSVVSQVHHRSMIQLQWHDGSTKNVHVDPVVLSGYEHHLDVALQLYRRRMEWLASGSRNTFGTLVEKRIVILVDMSLAMAGDILRLHNDMRSLLEQQIPSKERFNIICFGATVSSFQPKMVEPTEKNIDAAFKWFIRQPCAGSRKFMQAFRTGTENEGERKNGIEVDGVYLLTSGILDEPKCVACAFIQEAFVGRDASFHCIYYEPSGDDPLPVAGRYADIESTAAYLKDLAHCARGRFHRIRDDGVMESDDFSLISDEIEKAHNYKKKAELLLEALKQRYSKEEFSEQLEASAELVPRPPSSSKKRLGPPRQTALSQARINNIRPSSAKLSTPTKKRSRIRPHSALVSKDDMKYLTWKPNTATSSSSLIPPLPASSEETSTNHFRSSKNVIKAEQQTFYTEVGNETGYVFRSYHVPANPVSKKKLAISNVKIIPDDEENVTTKEWLRKYSLSKLKLDLNSIINATECFHSQSKIASLGKAVTAKYCEIFPTVTLNGIKKHLHLQPKELEEYGDKLELILKRYVKRLQWLLSATMVLLLITSCCKIKQRILDDSSKVEIKGSRKVFGSIVERKVILLVDVSGSMVTSIDELKKELESIIWQQIHKNDVNFSIMKFSTEPVLWSESLCEPSEQKCNEAIDWISAFEAYGGTCTIDALRLAFQMDGLQAVYLLSDGKPDTSTASVLREVSSLCSASKLTIHTISFNCEDSVANKFLQLLASQSGGRYHRYQGIADIEVSTHRLLSKDFNDENCDKIPVFEGDDARRLLKEIKLCRQYLSQARSYRDLYTSNMTNTNRPASRITVKDFPSANVHRTAAEVQ